MVSNTGSPTLRVEAKQRAEPDISVALLSGVPNHSPPTAFICRCSRPNNTNRGISLEESQLVIDSVQATVGRCVSVSAPLGGL
jgi:hypothetical protein